MTLLSTYLAMLPAQVNEFGSLAQFGMYGAVLVLVAAGMVWIVKAFMGMFRAQMDQSDQAHREEREQNQRLGDAMLTASKEIAGVAAESTRVAAQATETIASVNNNLQQHRENEEVRHQILVKELQQTRHEVRDGLRQINDEIKTRLPYKVGQAQSDTNA